MSTAVQATLGSNLPDNIKQLKSPRNILGLTPDELHSLLKIAHAEMKEVEKTLSRAEETLAQAEQHKIMIDALNNKDPRKKYSDYGLPETNNFAISPIGMLCIMVGLASSVLYMISPIVPILGLIFLIYGIVKMIKDMKKHKEKLKHEIETKLAEADQIYAEAQQAIDSAQAACLIPSDYRYTLALSTMLKFLENGRANDWTALADKYEEQLHRWTLEKNSNEALEYQRFSALKMEEAAGSAKTAAVASTISAVINISRLFG